MTWPETPVALDPSRIASQVVTGVGFIGAGTIIFPRNVVHGLITAAGLLAGLAFLDQLALRVLVAKFRRIIVEVPDRPGELGRLGTALGQMGVNIANIEVGQARGERLEVDLHLRVPADVELNQVMSGLETLEGIKALYRRPSYSWPAIRHRRRARGPEATAPAPANAAAQTGQGHSHVKPSPGEGAP